ncbi:MAG: ABC transporter permease [Candidatus Hydrogenedentes bacterium]|nr:ABC transporter permease [Candidatus Hydrogenedentota bacterium]
MIARLLHSRETALVIVLAVVFTLFALLTPNFLDAFSLLERTRYWIVPGLLAIPMTFIIATAGIDLSVGAIVALCAVVGGLLHTDFGWPMPLAAAAAMATGTLAGAFNGSVSSFLRIPPLVVTLATMTLYRGMALRLSEARSFSSFPDTFLWISQGDLFSFGAGRLGPLFFPVPLATLIVVGAVGAVLLRKSWIGRYTEHIGANPTAAVFAAIPVPWITCGLYTACGAVCGLTALFHTALYASAKADAATGMELEAIAAVVVGGTRISGGHASVSGSLLGLCLIGMLRYGLELAGAPSEWIIIIVGVLLIATVVLNEALARRAATRSL